MCVVPQPWSLFAGSVSVRVPAFECGDRGCDRTYCAAAAALAHSRFLLQHHAAVTTLRWLVGLLVDRQLLRSVLRVSPAEHAGSTAFFVRDTQW